MLGGGRHPLGPLLRQPWETKAKISLHGESSRQKECDGEKGRHEDQKVETARLEAERRESHRQPQDAEFREEKCILGF